jgi:hypothetical protein
MDIFAQCHCGASTIKTKKETVVGMVNCYCTDCYHYIGNFAPWVVCEKADTTLEGPIGAYESSHEAERLYCEECGSSVGKRTFKGPKIMILAGLFDGIDDLKVVNEVFVESRPKWSR